MNCDVKVIVATHKKYKMPKDKMYLPLHVGAKNKFDKNGKPVDFGYQRDDEGDNISEKNFCFGSQTGLYWLWKHVDADYLGLVHYRRHFLGKKQTKRDSLDGVITETELQPLLKKHKVFVPKKRKYYIETIYSHYCNTINGGKQELDLSKEIIEEIFPEYINAFNKVMHQRWGYMFNIMIMQKSLINNYCKWLFKILFELEKRVDTTGFSDFDKRYAGRVSEILFNVWLQYQLETENVKNEEIKELSYMENVNWKVKITSFLKAKLFKKKYEASF